MPQLNSGQKTLLIIFALFLLPVIGANVWYKLRPSDYRPTNTTNNGDFIEPNYSFENFEQTTATGEMFGGKDLERIWTLVHLIDGPCDEACSKRLYDTRQIRIALAEDMTRVQRIVVSDTAQNLQNNQRMWESHPDATLLVETPGGVAEQIRANTHAAHQLPESVYLIDPLGTLIMHFSPQLDPRLLMKDLEKLLRLSKVDE